MKKWLLIVLALGVGVGGAYAYGRASRQPAIDEQARKLEKAAASDIGLSAANRTLKKDLELAVEDSQELDGLVQKLRDNLASIEIPDAEIIEVEKWRTEEIKVKGDTIEEIIFRDQPGCEVPDLAFSIEEERAKLETKRGNQFVVGLAHLWLESPERAYLGNAEFKVDVTSLLVLDRKPAPKVRKLSVGAVALLGDRRGVGLRAAYKVKRLYLLAGLSALQSSGPETICFHQAEFCGEYNTPSQLTYEVGLAWAF
jgi:hypothetical protein